MSHAAEVHGRVRITLAGNLLGALITFFYFQFIDPGAAELPLSAAELTYFVVGCAVLTVVGAAVGRRWTAALVAPGDPAPPLARRRALLLPYMLAGLTLAAWTLAGIIWGVGWPLLAQTFSPVRSARAMFGITVIAGSVTTAFVFFAVENRWRDALPAFFPEGDLSSARDTPRLGVGPRLLVIFLLISVIPLSVLGVLAYTSATAVVGADPAASRALVRSLGVLILFVVGVGVVAAVGLSLFVARSVATPLGELERAMARVGQGSLEHRCPVRSNDELGAAAEGFNRMLDGLRERERIKETFGKYVTREIRDEILAGRIALEGQLREVTVLFADLRDFTPWVETTEPRQVVRDLNAYFTEMEGAIRQHGGLVLQFIGDEIEAVFGAPVPDPAHAEKAARAALEMRRRLAAWNAGRVAAGQRRFRHGIGIHTGPVLAGNIGSADRLSYALVGDTVNLASRIQGLTKEAGRDILVSGATRARLPDGFELAPLAATRVKGRSADVEVYGLVGAAAALPV